MNYYFDNIPQELKALPQWVCFNYEERTNNKGESHTTKVLKITNLFRNGNAVNAQANNPKTWRTFEKTLNAYRSGKYDGMGFVLKAGGGYVFIDIDKCIDTDGKASEKAQQIVDKFCNVAYIERSVSGRGYHIICKGGIDDYITTGRTGTKTGSVKIDGIKEIEVYQERRFLTFTGDIISGGQSVVMNGQDAIDWLFAEYPALNKKKRSETATKKVKPLTAVITLSENTIIDKIRQSEKGNKFSRLFDYGDITTYNNDDSAADMALMNMLPFWCGGDKELMRRIFSMSALAQREKWQKRKDYQDGLINEALNTWNGKCYDPAAYAKEKAEKEPQEMIKQLECQRKDKLQAEPLPTQELDETLDPAEWQKEDFRDREKLSALFKYIYVNNDRFLLETVKDRAKELKVTGITTLWAEFKKDLDKKVNAAEIAKQKSKLVSWADAGNFKLSPYTTSANGIYKEVAKKEETVFVKILSVPLLPVTILTNMETGNVKTRLRWKHKNRPAHEEIVDNRILADRSKILMLASRGLPVDSTNALEVVEYLSVVTANNDDIIPHEESVSSLGWHSNNDKFSPYDTDIIIDNVTENITMFRSIKGKGTLEEWTAFMTRYMADKRFHIVMATSFASVILRLIGTLPFILHFWGKSGTGKTVALMAAASVYGNPAPGAYLRSMDATTNATMRLAGFLRNLPVIADEMQTIRDREGNYDKFIMRVTEGVERGRLNSDSTIKALLEWNNIFITSGEEPIVNIRSGAGAVNRVIEVELDAAEPLFPGNIGNEVANFCREHYGMAAPEFIRKVKELGAESLKELYNTKVKTIMSESTTKQVLSAAAILIGSELASRWIFGNAVEPLQAADVLPYLKTELTVDPAERSYTALMNCFSANRKRFMSQKDDGKTILEYEPVGGEIWGKATKDGYFVNKGILERELQNIGFQFNVVKKQWADKGYLQKDSRGSYYYQRNEQGNRCEYVYMVAVTSKLQTRLQKKSSFEADEKPYYY